MLKMKIEGTLVEKDGEIAVESDVEIHGRASKAEIVGAGSVLAEAIESILPNLSKKEILILCKLVNRPFEEYASN